MMRVKLIPLAAVALLKIGAAHADGDVSFRVVDHGDTVEVIAKGLQLKSPTISPIRSRLEVPLVGNPIASRQMMQDATVLQVELDGIATRVLSVKTKLERPEVHDLAKLAQATQVGDELHMTFPRHAIATPVAPTAPTTNAPAPAAAAIAKPADAKPADAKPAAATPPTIPTPAAAATAPAPFSPAPAPAPEKHAIPPETRDWSSTGMYALCGLGALGVAAYMMKKKRGVQAPATTIDVVAQRALGGKAKVMWLAAGRREMIVAVTGTQVRMLGQWQRDAQPQPSFAASMSSALAPAPLPTATVERAPEPPSASVAGILKLRASSPAGARTSTSALALPADDEQAPDGDIDLAWAKEILAAGGRR